MPHKQKHIAHWVFAVSEGQNLQIMIKVHVHFTNTKTFGALLQQSKNNFTSMIRSS